MCRPFVPITFTADLTATVTDAGERPSTEETGNPSNLNAENIDGHLRTLLAVIRNP